MPASFHQEGQHLDYKPAAAVTAGDVKSIGGRIGIANRDIDAGKLGALNVRGVWKIPGAAGVFMKKGQRAYWTGAAASFWAPGRLFLGELVQDKAAADEYAVVAINVESKYPIDLNGGSTFDTTTVSANASVTKPVGGVHTLTLAANSEAEKTVLISDVALAISAGIVAEFRVAKVSGTTSDVDMDFGLASADDSDNFEEIPFHAAFHFDGGALDTFVQCDDGVNDVGPVDAGVDHVLGTYYHYLIDATNLSDVKFYIDGVQVVVTETTFKLDQATGSLKLIVHIEKASGTATGVMRVERMLAWTVG